MVESAVSRHAWGRRAFIAALVGVGTGVAAHVMMGGALPGLLGIVPAAVLTMGIGLFLLKRRSLVGALATSLLGQWLTHELAVLGAPYDSPGLHAHHTVAWQPGVLPDLPMTAGHVVAALVTTAGILLVHRIGQLASQLRTLLANSFHAVWPKPWDVAARIDETPIVAVTARQWRPSPLFQRNVMALRGPPVDVAVDISS